MALEPISTVIGGALKLAGEAIAWIREAFGERSGPEHSARWARDAQRAADLAAEADRPVQDRLAACRRALELCRRIEERYPDTNEARELTARRQVLRMELQALEALRIKLQEELEQQRRAAAQRDRERSAVARLRALAEACTRLPTVDCILTVAEAALAELQNQAAKSNRDYIGTTVEEAAQRAIVSAMSERMDASLVRAKSQSFGGIAGNATTIAEARDRERAGDIAEAIRIAAQLSGDDGSNLLFGIARRQAARGRPDLSVAALRAVVGASLLVDWHARELAEDAALRGTLVTAMQFADQIRGEGEGAAAAAAIARAAANLPEPAAWAWARDKAAEITARFSDPATRRDTNNLDETRAGLVLLWGLLGCTVEYNQALDAARSAANQRQAGCRSVVAQAAIAVVRCAVEGASITPELQAAEAAMNRCWGANQHTRTFHPREFIWLLRAILAAKQPEAADRQAYMATQLEAEPNPGELLAWACVDERDFEQLLACAGKVADPLERARVLIEALRYAVRLRDEVLATRLATAAASAVDEIRAMADDDSDRFRQLINDTAVIRHRHAGDEPPVWPWLTMLRASLFHAAASRLSTVRGYATVFPATMQIL